MSVSRVEPLVQKMLLSKRKLQKFHLITYLWERRSEFIIHIARMYTTQHNRLHTQSFANFTSVTIGNSWYTRKAFENDVTHKWTCGFTFSNFIFFSEKLSNWSWGYVKSNWYKWHENHFNMASKHNTQNQSYFECHVREKIRDLLSCLKRHKS